jgi:sirohydrochlorin ferrochelatase
MSAIPDSTGVILIDHGSRQQEANDMLLEVVGVFKQSTDIRIVEAAHMELAEPTLAQAFDSCISQGASEIVIHPYFLSPGRHSTQDIPQMAEDAAAAHANIPYTVTEPLGIDPDISNVVLARIRQALEDRD